MFEHLTEQFLYALSSHHERLPTHSRGPVHTPVSAAVQGQPRAHVSLAFHPVQNRVQRACTQTVSVPPEFVDHRLAEDGAFGCMMQDMEANQTGVEITINHRHSMSNSDKEYRAYCEAFGGVNQGWGDP